MKHPGYSKASNQYATRANVKLSRSSKEAHRATMKALAERLKKISNK